MTKAKLGLSLLLMMGLADGAGVLANPLRSEKQAEAKPAAKSDSPKSEALKRERTDRFGDPLPLGATARLGTIRLRHSNIVNAVAFAPDGKSVVSGGYDGWAFQWDVQTGKRVRAFQGGLIQSIAIDPAGKRLVLANGREDGKLTLYELATGKELATHSGHRGGARIVVFSPDGKWLASGGRDQRIRVWDADTLRERRSWQADDKVVQLLRFTPDGKQLASVGDEGRLRFWDVSTAAEQSVRAPLAEVRLVSFCFFADGKTLLTGSATAPGLLQLWDVTTGKEIRTLARARGAIGYLALAPDGKSVWALTVADGPRQWDLATGKQLLHLPRLSSTRRIADLALSPDGKRLATCTFSYDVFVWDTTTGRKVPDPVGHRFLTTSAVFTPDGRQLWSGGYDETIRCWSADSGEQLRLLSLQRHEGDLVYSLALRPDAKMLAAGIIRLKIPPRSPPCDVRLWDLTTGKEREPLHGHGDWVTAAAFSPDGRLLASRGEDQTIRLWDVATGKERALLRCGQAGAKGIVFSPDGLRVISALDKETIGFWDVESGRRTRRLSTGLSGGNDIPILSRDGRMLVTGGGSGQPLHAWEVASGKERCRIERPKPQSYVVAALSPDSRILVWFDHGQPIMLWDLIADKQLGELGDRTNMADALSLTFSHDSRRLASTHSDGTGLIWDVARLSSKAAAPARISAKQLEELWNELAGADAAKVYHAVRTLSAAPAQSVPLLRQRLSKTASTDVAKITRLLMDLDSEQFEIREQASRRLQELGMSAETAMRRTLHKQPSLEVRRRLESILDKLESGERTAEELRTLRAVEVLELIGSSEAQRLLRELSQGPADAWLTQEVKAALTRLAQRSEPRP